MPDEPLSLSCYCPGDTSVTQCTVQTLTWIVQGWRDIEYALITLAGGPETVAFNVPFGGEALTSLNPVPDWLDAWDGLYAFLTIGASLNLGDCDAVADAGPDAAKLEVGGCSVSIKVDWTCVDLGTGEVSTVSEIRSAKSGDGELTCPGHCGLPPRLVVYKTTWAGGSAVGGGVSFSRALSGECTFFDSPPVSDFGPNPRDKEKFEVNRTDSNFCLCASGGTAPYVYRIKSGVLPCGQSFDPSTGCITGTPDGTCHGTTVVFEVFDSAGNTAEATCDFVPDCEAGPELENFLL